MTKNFKNTAKYKQFKELPPFGQKYIHSIFWYYGTKVTVNILLSKITFGNCTSWWNPKSVNSHFSTCLPLHKEPTVSLTHSIHCCFYLLIPTASLILEYQVFKFYVYFKTLLLMQWVSHCQFTQIFIEHLSGRHHDWLKELEVCVPRWLAHVPYSQGFYILCSPSSLQAFRLMNNFWITSPKWNGEGPGNLKSELLWKIYHIEVTVPTTVDSL